MYYLLLLLLVVVVVVLSVLSSGLPTAAPQPVGELLRPERAAACVVPETETILYSTILY